MDFILMGFNRLQINYTLEFQTKIQINNTFLYQQVIPEISNEKMFRPTVFLKIVTFEKFVNLKIDVLQVKNTYNDEE